MGETRIYLFEGFLCSALGMLCLAKDSLKAKFTDLKIFKIVNKKCRCRKKSVPLHHVKNNM